MVGALVVWGYLWYKSCGGLVRGGVGEVWMWGKL